MIASARPTERNTGTTARSILSALALFGLMGCGELDPDIGPDQVVAPTTNDTQVDETCGIEDSDPSTTVSFNEIRDTIFRNECGCHTEPNGLGRLLGGLDLDSAEAILAGSLTAGDRVVVPGNPCASVLIQKLRDDPPFGSRMPRGGPPLESRFKTLLMDWIIEGAQ